MSDLDLLLVIGERFVGEGEGVLLDFHILVGVDQVPVNVFDLVDGGDHLEAERDVGELAVILRDDDEATVGKRAETLEQMLSQFGAETGVQSRTVDRELVVGGDARVIEADRQRGAASEALVIQKVRGAGVGVRNRAGERVGGERVASIDRKGAGQNRIVGSNGRADTEGGTDDAERTAAGSAATAGGAASASAGRTGCAAEAAHATAGCSLHNTGVDAEDVRAGFAAQNVGVGNAEVIARDGEVEIVLECEGDGIVHRNDQLAVANQILNAWRVGEVRRGNLALRVGSNRIGEVGTEL